MVDAGFLDAMADHAWLINVARGGLVDHEALLDALLANKIGGAGLDVTTPEPLPDGHPVWDVPNCIISPTQRSFHWSNGKQSRPSSPPGLVGRLLAGNGATRICSRA
jgi:lactate dehydrogenase-like 2-hydroxyacid dehydrogenase